MKLFGMPVIEHPSVPAEEAWVVRRRDAEQVPPDLRGSIEVPCILTGNMFLLRRTVELFRIIEMWEEEGTTSTRKGGAHAKAAHARRSF